MNRKLPVPIDRRFYVREIHYDPWHGARRLSLFARQLAAVGTDLARSLKSLVMEAHALDACGHVQTVLAFD
jgi:hypothetical protein